ncbi:MAG: hypothetical protein RIS47_186 [Bacteroidota bacterium]|jgi:fructose-1,6-bisphosphatase I
MKIANVKTLNEYIIERQREFPYAKGELSRLLHHIGIAAKLVQREVSKAGLVDIIGESGATNIQGEDQKILDVFADKIFIRTLLSSGEVCGIASEENDELIAFDTYLAKEGKYIVTMDPLDGSSNIDVNVSIGTVFSIYRRISERGTMPDINDFLQEGTKQIAAGYVIYGSSTMLVYTTGHGVHGFTLDPSIGEFCLSHHNIKTPEDGSIYSVNEGNYVKFPVGVKKYIKHCQESDPKSNRPYTSRYIGSLVSDFHRNLLKGGIYIYPPTEKNPEGKLRLLYECNPIALLAEQAGGIATDGYNRILDIKPTALHQRVAFYTGSTNMVNKLMDFLNFFDNL